MDSGSGEWSGASQRPPLQTSSGQDDENPACQSCRRRKLKCSRELPLCSNCIRFASECLYDKKQKPGMKPGAVESLSRRLEVLEKILLDGEGNQKPLVCNAASHAVNGGQPLNNNPSVGHTEGNSFLNEETHVDSGPQLGLSRKRKRQAQDYESLSESWDLSDYTDTLSALPPQRTLDAILDTYFKVIHPWVPLIHEGRFRARLENSNKRLKYCVVLHALVAITMKHVKFDDYGMSKEEAIRQIRRSRNVVMLSGMDSLSVENLQALVLIAFDYMGSGQDSKAWSIIGSLTRTVEYLQLTVEPDDAQGQPLLRPRILLPKPESALEAEERRRVFWNVFLLDRFCSLTSGWSTSLTSDDVRRRLPCEGGIWRRGEYVITPYFGIWSKSAAKIGTSIAYISPLYPPNEIDPATAASPSDSNAGSSVVDKSKLGALAYRIEATESLNQVTSFFLQQRVDFRNRQEVGSWLTRFKELDLRLVHWKMFLPQRWKDSNISRDVSFVSMDPNLTVAHLNHNASMILLHQHIAYPPVDWSGIVKLPSSCSAETCQLAAVEIASIAKKFLTHTPGIVTGQFPFSAFIAARVLLVHWRYNDANLSLEFFSIIESLKEMSKRWQGYLLEDNEALDRADLDAAAKYALKLEELHARCMADKSYRMDIFGYSDETPKSTGSSGSPSAVSRHDASPSSQSSHVRTKSFNQHTAETIGATPRSSFSHGRPMYPIQSQSSPAGPFNPQSGRLPSVDRHNGMRMNPTEGGNRTGSTPGGMSNPGLMNMNYPGEMMDDELTAMSHVLLGQQFLEMDRVITLDGTDFDIDMSSWGNMH